MIRSRRPDPLLPVNLLALPILFAAFAPPPGDADSLFFENEVRPLLDEHCFRCHGPEKKRVKGGLRFTGHESLLTGGDTGAAVVPDAPDESLLIHAIRWEDEDLRMPPKTKLADPEIATLVDWVRRGAPWPTYEEAAPGDPEDDGGPRAPSIEDGRSWWSFRPIEDRVPPTVKNTGAVSNPIDAFVIAGLEAEGLSPSPAAPPRELVRRATFDLIGLPPTQAEVAAFERDPSDAAWARLIDSLLARPEYGERWGRHWLDVVRFAQTNGYERDAEKPFAWRYRDYVVRAFNRDKPFDRFVVEQLAGDELERPTNDSRIATGFYRIGVWDDEPDDEERAIYDELDDVVRTTSEGFLGLTIGCARCHDHKFDPIPQEDYYRFVSFVRGIRPTDKPLFRLDSATHRPLDAKPMIDAWRAERSDRIASLKTRHLALTAEDDRRIAAALPTLSAEVRQAYATPVGKRSDDQKLLLNRSLAPFRTGSADQQAMAYELKTALEAARNQHRGDLSWALMVREDGPEPPATHLLVRGDPHSPAQEVAPRFPAVVCRDDAAAVVPAPVPGRKTSGRRKRLAEWIASPTNPLTARVLVNRLWRHHFGRGIVATPNDFGRTGARPTHPALLDWLANEFVRGGWTMKRMHRLILTSSTWRQSSRAADAAAIAADESNLLWWRQGTRRLDAEAVRDSMLAAAGILDPTRGGRGFFPDLPKETMSGASRPGEGWGFSSETERNRRSIYVYAKRNLRDPLLEAFDAASVNLPIGSRPVTTVSTQSLMLLNGKFAHRVARAFADRVAAEAGDDDARRIDVAFRHALSRRPTAEEASLSQEVLTARHAPEPGVTFGPRTDVVLEKRFLAAATADDLVYGPRGEFTPFRGAWGNPYNDTLQADPARGPGVLANAGPFGDGVVRAEWFTGPGTRTAGLLVRAAPSGDGITGLEIRFDPHARWLHVVHHQDEGTAEVVAKRAVRPYENVLRVNVQVVGERVVLRPIYIPANPTLPPHDVTQQSWGPPNESWEITVDVPGLAPTGRVGVRFFGGPVTLTRLDVDEDSLLPAAPDDPRRRALEALCLVLLNLNEFVTID